MIREPLSEGAAAAALSAATDGILVVDTSGRCTFVNRAGADALGYAPAELLGAPVHELLHHSREDGSVHPVAECPTTRTLEAGVTSRVVDDVMWRRDASPLPVEFSSSPIIEGGAVTGAVVVFRDVTDQHRARAEARARLDSAAELAELLELTSVAVMLWDLDGGIVLWNAGSTQMYGWTREEALGRKPHDLLNTQFPTPLPEVERALFDTGQWAGELRHLTRDGRRMVSTSQWSLRRDAAGRPNAVLECNVDTTAAAAADAKFRGLLEAAPDAIVGVAPDGRIALVNAQAERLFGYGREDLIGEPVELLVPEAARAVHPGHRRTYFADPAPRPMGAGMQLAARRRDGTEFPAEISLSAVETEEGTLVSAAIRDVTERNEVQAVRERLKVESDRARVQAQVLQARRLESLGQLAGGVAHDFNNLLAVILNYAAFVAQEVDAEAAASANHRWRGVSRDIEQIRLAAERATDLTHQLLAFGRREVVHPAVIDLNGRVAATEQMLLRTLGEHIVLRAAAAAGLWSVLADPGQIDQVLVNLAVNARDAMPGGGALTIDTENIDVDEVYAAHDPGVVPGRHVRLRVSDTGVGMDKQTLDQVFEPFFTTKPKGQGTGLGLATVYGVVAQAGGHVKIYSEPGIGTTVSILLPAVDGEPAQPVPRSSTSDGRARGKTVLLVEDEDAMREVTRRILTRNGYQVLEAPLGPAAVTLAVEHRGEIDLLLTDVVMPKMLGKEVAQGVVGARPGIPVLYMSGYAQPVLASQGTLDEGVRLIEKPFTEAVLLEKVREVLDAGN